MPDFTKSKLTWNLTWDADWVTAVAFCGSTRRVAAGNNLGQIVVWELPEKPGGDAPKPILRLDGHTNVISRLMCTPDGKTLLSASYDRTIRYWDPFAKPEGEAKLVLNASAIEDAERRKNNGAKVPPAMPATVGLVKPTRTLDAHKEWVVNLDLSRDGTQFITGDDAGQIIVWDRAAATILKRWPVKGWAYALALSPDKKQACVGERYPVVFDSARHAGLKLWNATSGEMIKDIAEEIGVHPSTVSRAVAGKYAHTPQGVFELRTFFSEAVQGPSGSAIPLQTLKRMVKKMIDEEDSAKPLTDDHIAARLKQQGIQVTRRTVAKYREDLKIPSTHHRRVRE